MDMDFENEFDHKTVYRGPPTPKLEKAWEELFWRADFPLVLRQAKGNQMEP
jgi:hypothetical protein